MMWETHMERVEELEAKKKEVEDAREKLSSFQALPMDEAMARIQLLRKKTELEALKRRRSELLRKMMQNQAHIL